MENIMETITKMDIVEEVITENTEKEITVKDITVKDIMEKIIMEITTNLALNSQTFTNNIKKIVKEVTIAATTAATIRVDIVALVVLSVDLL